MRTTPTVVEQLKSINRSLSSHMHQLRQQAKQPQHSTELVELLQQLAQCVAKLREQQDSPPPAMSHVAQLKREIDEIISRQDKR